MMYVESKEESGFTPYFDELLKQVSRIENGKDVPESTRLNIAIQKWQQVEFGDVYPIDPDWEKQVENFRRLVNAIARDAKHPTLADGMPQK